MPTRLTRDVVERLFARGSLSRRQLLAGLAACGLSVATIKLLVGSDFVSTQADAQVADYLCLIVLDGFRPEYAELAPMPAFDDLAHRGTFYERAWVGQVESETPVSHATLSTGALPRHHGVIGFEWRDPASGREVLDGWEQGALLGQVGKDIHRNHAACIPRAIKQANPRARVITLSSEKVYAADALGARAADYVLYHRIAHGRLLPSALPGQAPPEGFFSRAALYRTLPLQSFSDWDDLSTELALAALQEFKPEGLMVNLPGADIYGHAYGGLASPTIMAKVVAGLDRSIARLAALYREVGLFDRTLFVITADHGMVSNHRSVGPDDVQAALDRAGADDLFHTGGSAKYMYLDDRSRLRAAAAAREMGRLPGVAGAYVRTGAGRYESAGKHLNPGLDAAFHYLLSTFSGPTAPDVAAPYRENTIGTHIPHAYGNHGGFSWGSQTIPLLLAGPGVRAGARSQAAARVVDVAPTILRLLGLPAAHVDGVPLADALEDPSAEDAHAQTAIDPALRRHRDALSDQSERDVWEDRKAGLHSPPPRP